MNIDKVIDFFTLVNPIVNTLSILITTLITWYVAQLNIKNKTISYEYSKLLLINKLFNSTSRIQIICDQTILDEPYLISLDIKNRSKLALTNIEFFFEFENDIKVMSSFFEQLPYLYEEIWFVELVNEKKLKIVLNRINSNEISKIRFFTNKDPGYKYKVNCLQENVKIKKGNARMLNLSILDIIFLISLLTSVFLFFFLRDSLSTNVRLLINCSFTMALSFAIIVNKKK